eukprot:scaffold24401_cov115-Isochrysis_galbana.AAC.4
MRGFSRWRRHSNGERHPRRRRVGRVAAEQVDADQCLQGHGGRSGQAARGDTPPLGQRCGRLGEVVRLRAQALGDGVRRLLAARRRRAAVRVHVRVEAVPRLELGELGNALQLPRGPDDVLARRLHGRRRGRAGVGAPRRAQGILGAAHALAGRRRVGRLRHAEGRVGAGGAGRVPHRLVVVFLHRHVVTQWLLGGIVLWLRDHLREVGGVEAECARVLVLVHHHAHGLGRHLQLPLATRIGVVVLGRDLAHERVHDSRGVAHRRVGHIAVTGGELLHHARMHKHDASLVLGEVLHERLLVRQAAAHVVVVVVDDALLRGVEEPDGALLQTSAIIVLGVRLVDGLLHLNHIILVLAVLAVDDAAEFIDVQGVELVVDERVVVDSRVEEAAVVVHPHDVVAVGLNVVRAHRPHVFEEAAENVDLVALHERDLLRHPHVRKPLDDRPQLEVV